MLTQRKPIDENSDRHQGLPMLFALGFNDEKIAGLLDKSEAHVAIIRKSPLMKSFIQEAADSLIVQSKGSAVKSLNDQFDDASQQAFDTLSDLLVDSESDTVRLGAARDILDRAPNAPKTRKEVVKDEKITISFGEKERNLMKEGMAEIGAPFMPQDPIQIVQSNPGNGIYDTIPETKPFATVESILDEIEKEMEEYGVRD